MAKDSEALEMFQVNEQQNFYPWQAAAPRNDAPQTLTRRKVLLEFTWNNAKADSNDFAVIGPPLVRTLLTEAQAARKVVSLNVPLSAAADFVLFETLKKSDVVGMQPNGIAGSLKRWGRAVGDGLRHVV
ncbi:hypothetical protein R3P38DRAFT_2771067 [Favolaschia claudopus]|uniref:Uncharacterized protein n=1 Tax=Favolaschia claudopus TaxID=2862362 RepID=A0AAW0CB84_9AGAR